VHASDQTAASPGASPKPNAVAEDLHSPRLSHFSVFVDLTNKVAAAREAI